MNARNPHRQTARPAPQAQAARPAPEPAQATRDINPGVHVGDIPPQLLNAYFQVLEATFADNPLMSTFTGYIQDKLNETAPEPEPE